MECKTEVWNTVTVSVTAAEALLFLKRGYMEIRNNDRLTVNVQIKELCTDD